jgi:hypothetical protein
MNDPELGKIGFNSKYWSVVSGSVEAFFNIWANSAARFSAVPI